MTTRTDRLGAIRTILGAPPGATTIAGWINRDAMILHAGQPDGLLYMHLARHLVEHARDATQDQDLLDLCDDLLALMPEDINGAPIGEGDADD